VHTATSDASSTESWDSGNQGVGQTYSHTFTKAGTFAYHCTPHMTAMKGTVIVQ
jgi:plastocyanin